MGASHISGPLLVDGVNVTGMNTGSYYYVDANLGNAAYDGLTPSTAKATLAQALNLCTANKGDVIVLMPGHYEDTADAQIAVDVAGVNIIGLGQGATRPRFDFNHANASIDVEANDCVIHNVTLLPSVTDVLIGIDVTAGVTGTLLSQIETLPGEDGGGVDDFALVVDIKAGCTRTVVDGLKVRQHASGAGYLAGVRFTGASDDCVVKNCDIWILGAGVVAPINGLTTLSTKLRIENNVLTTDAEPGIELLTGTTGVIRNNSIFTDLATIDAAIVADGCALFENYYVEVGGEAGAEIGTVSTDD